MRSSIVLWLILISEVVLVLISAAISPPVITPPTYKSQQEPQGIEINSLTKTIYGFWPYWTNPDSYQPNWNALTHIAYFSWSANSDGTLNAPSNITRYNTVKSYAQQNGVKIVICVTCFDKDTQDSIFAYHKTDLANNILDVLQTYGADGVNLDFEFPRTTNSYTGESNTDLFEQLMSILYNTLKNANPDYHISFCIAGGVETVYRNANLSQYVDAIFLMGYDYHWASASTTGAVSPYNDPNQFDVVDSVNILLNYYPREKIILGVPFYGYDWPCDSDQPGATTTGTGSAVLMKYAVQNAQTYGRRWDSNSNTPWYAYQSGGEWHQCWYDDEESLALKWDYVNSANLCGTGFWALGYETSEIWDVVLEKFSGSQITGPLTGKVIAIDPGHGGNDSGATGIDGSAFPNEEDFTLDIGLRVKELLEAAGATVVMTRESDVDVSLQERCDIANNANADIFVSIHMNSAATESAWGTETFYWAENDTVYSAEGKALAEYIQSRVVSRLGTYDRGIKGDKPYLGYHLYVLDNTYMPAILVEVAFISNQSDFNLVSQEEARSKAALAIYEGICDYFGVEPVYGTIELSGYPSSNSPVTRTVYFRKEWSNTSLITRAYWYIDGNFMGELYHREWFFDSPPFSQPVINTYDFPIGWHTIKIVTENLWCTLAEHNISLFFQRSPIVNAKIYGSPSAPYIADDNDTSYGGNNLGDPVYIELPCNFTIRALKIHWWDDDDRYYQYKVEISTDNRTWVEVVNKTSGEYRSWQWDEINAKARWIRITGTYNSANQWYQIKEVHIIVPIPQSYVVYGYVYGTSEVTIKDLTNGNSKTINVTNNYYEFDLYSLNFSYGDEIEVSVTGDSTVFVAQDPETSRRVDLTAGMPEIPLVFFLLLISIIFTVIFFPYKKLPCQILTLTQSVEMRR